MAIPTSHLEQNKQQELNGQETTVLSAGPKPKEMSLVSNFVAVQSQNRKIYEITAVN